MTMDDSDTKTGEETEDTDAHTAEGGAGEQAQDSGEDTGPDEERTESAGDTEEEEDEAKQEIRRLEEEGPPENLEDWPTGKAMYETYGGPEGEHGYHEGPEQKMGPSSLRHHEGGEVEIEGEMVDDPEEYKGEPIPGGPTDPNAPDAQGEREQETKDED